MSDNRWLTERDLWVKPEKRVQGVRVSRAKSKTSRFDCEGYQIAQPLDIKGEVEDEGVICGVHDPMFGQTQIRGSKVRKTINRG